MAVPLDRRVLINTEFIIIRIGDEGAGRLAAVLGQCASLDHLNLGGNGIGAEGAGRLAALAEHCPSISIFFDGS